jgi:CubicO group peptidase (beta-lactamase class C family)
MKTPGAAGAICSNVLDLLAWQRGFDAARLISPASRDKMRTSAKLTNGTETHYGFGLGVGSFEGHRAVSHSGGVNGFATWLGRFPDDDVTVVVLSNAGSGPASRIGQLISRLMLGIELPKIADLEVPADLRARVVGTYDLGAGKLVVREAGGQLWAQFGPVPDDRLMYQGNGEFRPKGNPDFSIKFETSPEGGTATLSAPGGQPLKGKKITTP